MASAKVNQWLGCHGYLCYLPYLLHGTYLPMKYGQVNNSNSINSIVFKDWSPIIYAITLNNQCWQCFRLQMLRLIIFLRSSLLLSNHYLWFCNVIRLEQRCFSLILKYLHVSIVFSYLNRDTQIIDWHEILTDTDFKQNNICQQKLFCPMVVKCVSPWHEHYSFSHQSAVSKFTQVYREADNSVAKLLGHVGQLKLWWVVVHSLHSLLRTGELKNFHC